MKGEFLQMSLEIQHRIAWVYRAIEARRKLDKANVPQVRAKTVRAEENICIQSRALFSKFVDTSLWRDGMDPEVAEVVRQALTAARDAISEDQQCRDAVDARLRKFKGFWSSSTVSSIL
jgi:hypothetical protein